MKRKIFLLCAMLLAGFFAIAQNVQFGLYWMNSNVLEVRAKSSADLIQSPDDKIGTCQVTIKASSDALEIAQVIPVNLSWHITAFAEGPAEASGSDYYSFITEGGSSVSMQAGQEVPLFRIVFSLKGKLGEIALVEDGDPFLDLPNSLGTNPGNAFFNTGGDLYNGVYHNPAIATDLAEAPEHAGKLSVFPNPLQPGHSFTVLTGMESGGMAKVMVINPAGQVVSANELPVTPEMDMPALDVANGVYLIQLITDQKVMVGRLVVGE